MASVPIYPTGCIAPDASSSGAGVLLVGVPANQDGRLEIYSVKLGDLSAPTATFVGNDTNEMFWSVRGQRICLPYLGFPASGNIPILVQQFYPATSYFTNVYPNGTIDGASYFPLLGFTSPKHYALTGSAGTMDWVTAMGNVTGAITSSPWVGLLTNGTRSIASTRDFMIGMYPTTTPLVTVGIYTLQTDTPGPGYVVVFDSKGGTIYSVTDSFNTAIPSHLTTLTMPTPVSMNNIILSSSAFSQSGEGTGYIFDKGPDGSTILYSISPSKSPKLQYVAAAGNVPQFSAAMASTVLGSKIVIYTSSTSAGIFNAFDIGTGTWSGPGLVKPSFTPPPTTPDNPPTDGSSDGSKTPIGAIVGGVVGVMVAIALVSFLVIRSRRLQEKAKSTTVVNAGYQDENKLNNPAAAPLMQQNYALQHQQQPHQQFQGQAAPISHVQQQQQFNPHYQQQPFQEQFHFAQPINTSPAFVPQPVPPPVQQTSTPIIFQPHTQESYNYTPPTLVTQTQEPTAVSMTPIAQSPERKSYNPPVSHNPHTSPGLSHTSLPFSTRASMATTSPNSNNPQAIIPPIGCEQSTYYPPGNPQLVPPTHNSNGYAQ